MQSEALLFYLSELIQALLQSEQYHIVAAAVLRQRSRNPHVSN